MKTTVALGALFILIIGGGILWTRHANRAETASQAAQPAPATATSTGSYTAAQVALHDTSKDCWASINGGVYNLTSWITQHPGGESAIATICGKDGSAAFDGQHGSDPRAQSMLATFRIGSLAQ